MLVRDKKRRAIRPPSRYAQADRISFSLTVAEEIDKIEPRTYEVMMRSKDKKLCVQAMQEEMAALKKNNTWNLL